MIRDFTLGVLTSCVVFSFTFMVSYRSLLIVPEAPPSPPCKSTCQIILTEERVEIQQQVEQQQQQQQQQQQEGAQIAGKEEFKNPVKMSAELLLWTPLRDSHDNWQVGRVSHPLKLQACCLERAALHILERKKVPDRTFVEFRASKSVDRQVLLRSEV